MIWCGRRNSRLPTKAHGVSWGVLFLLREREREREKKANGKHADPIG